VVTVKIDGREIQTEKGRSLLEVARSAGINIPALCYHPAVSSYGSCRTCIVEVRRKGSYVLTASCTYPVEHDIEVQTNSERVKKARGLVVEMLLARCPEVQSIREMAAEMGITATRLPQGDSNCILCGLCVRVCSEVIGANAIGFSGRGLDKKATSPFEIASAECIGCGACAIVCPTQAIRIDDVNGFRRVNLSHAELERAVCTVCGASFFPTASIAHLKKIGAGGLLDLSGVCPTCRRKNVARVLGRTSSGDK